MLMVSHAIDPVRFNHAIAVTLTCNAVAVQQGCPAYEAVTPDEVYALFESFGWRCPITGIAHSDRTPLYISTGFYPLVTDVSARTRCRICVL